MRASGRCRSSTEIDAALEDAWQAREDGADRALRKQSREHALQYDADVILREHWVPFLAGWRRAWREAHRRSRRPGPCGPGDVPRRARHAGDAAARDGRPDRPARHRRGGQHAPGRPEAAVLPGQPSAGSEAHASRITHVAGGPCSGRRAMGDRAPQRDAAWPVHRRRSRRHDIVLICDADEIPSR